MWVLTYPVQVYKSAQRIYVTKRVHIIITTSKREVRRITSFTAILYFIPPSVYIYINTSTYADRIVGICIMYIRPTARVITTDAEATSVPEERFY